METKEIERKGYRKTKQKNYESSVKYINKNINMYIVMVRVGKLTKLKSAIRSERAPMENM